MESKKATKQSREEKQLDVGLEGIIQRVHELKTSISTFIFKLEQEYLTMNWPTVLDNFALLSGQINTLNRLMKGDKMPSLKNYLPIPYRLSPDVDIELEKLTEGRVLVFNHEVVPNYLRTKPEPEIEEKMGQMMNKANNITADNLMKQINLLNKLSNQIQETLRSSKDTLDGEFNQKGVSSQMSSQNDTNNLISAIVFGKNLKPNQSMNTSSVNQQQMSDQRSSLPPVISGMAPTKAPSSIKTNIKAAANLHPYNR